MKTATQLIYEAAGLDVVGTMSGTCALCGAGDTRGEDFSLWVKKTFTNWSDIHPGGTIICDACEFCCREGNEFLTARLGSEKPQKMRNYSHFVDQSGRWYPLSKAHKRRMYEFLTGEQQPLVAVIADSGQKHLCFRAQPGWWCFEGINLEPDSVQLQAIMTPAQRLYDAGISKTEISSGQFRPNSIAKLDTLDEFLALSKELEHDRGSPYFALAVFLLTKTTSEVSDDR